MFEGFIYLLGIVLFWLVMGWQKDSKYWGVFVFALFVVVWIMWCLDYVR